eukprot:PLAT3565.4.p1 GENE.PLAT3565.4~~PLAT3565.4.p1  ORF type:complete len:416 (+),score=121.68 PLAT3565.4:181-1248(+)
MQVPLLPLEWLRRCIMEKRCISFWALTQALAGGEVKKYIKISGILCALLIVTNFFFFFSLNWIGVPVQSTVFQSSSAFVFLLSVPVLKERVTAAKIAAVISSLTGVAFVSFFARKTSGARAGVKPYIGDVMDLGSAVTWAIYEVYIAHAFGHGGDDEDDDGDSDDSDSSSSAAGAGDSESVGSHYSELADAPASATAPSSATGAARDAYGLTHTAFDKAWGRNMLWMTFMGVWALFVFWFPLLLQPQLGLQPFRLPAGAKELVPFWMNIFVILFVNLLLNYGIIAASPLFIAVASQMTIPTSLVFSVFLHGAPMTALQLVGAGLVILGFVLLNIKTGSAKKQPDPKTEELTSVMG